MNESNLKIKAQNVVIEDRSNISISGVDQADSFNDNNSLFYLLWKEAWVLREKGLMSAS